VPVEFAISGESASDIINDASIHALLEDPGPPVGEEDVTVFWFDNAYIDTIIGNTYDLYPKSVIEPKANPNEYRIDVDPRLPNNPATLPFEDSAVVMHAGATLKPDGLDCSIPQVSNILIGITQNASEWESSVDYWAYLVEWVPNALDGTPSEVTAIEIDPGLRVTDRFPIGVRLLGWIMDSAPEFNPLYTKFFSVNDRPTNSVPPLILKPPTPCAGHEFSWTNNTITYTGNIWDQDTPHSLVWKTYPYPFLAKDPTNDKMDATREPIEIMAPGTDILVARVKYYWPMTGYKKERFRTWVVTYEKRFAGTPYEVEEVVPLRETEWWMDIDTGSQDPLKRQVQTSGYHYAPRHLPVSGPPYPNQIQHSNEDLSYRPEHSRIPLGNKITVTKP
jgi:hypothetical protein